MVRTQIQLEEAQYQRLRTLASAQSKSVAQLVRDGVDQLLARESAARRWAKAWETVGSARDREGLSDVAREHDTYLAEAYRGG